MLWQNAEGAITATGRFHGGMACCTARWLQNSLGWCCTRVKLVFILLIKKQPWGCSKCIKSVGERTVLDGIKGVIESVGELVHPNRWPLAKIASNAGGIMNAGRSYTSSSRYRLRCSSLCRELSWISLVTLRNLMQRLQILAWITGISSSFKQ